MVPFNGLIETHIVKMSSFLDALSNPPDDRSYFIPKADNIKKEDPIVVTDKEIYCITENLAKKSMEIVNSLSGDSKTIFLTFHDTVLKKVHEESGTEWKVIEKPKEELKIESKELEGLSKEAYILTREALQQCEAELKELRNKLEEERILRQSMQHIIVNMADTMHTQIDERVKIHVDKVMDSDSVDLEFCNLLHRRTTFYKQEATPLINIQEIEADKSLPVPLPRPRGRVVKKSLSTPKFNTLQPKETKTNQPPSNRPIVPPRKIQQNNISQPQITRKPQDSSSSYRALPPVPQRKVVTKSNSFVTS